MKRASFVLATVLLVACGGASGGGIESSVVRVDAAAAKALPQPPPSGPCSASEEGVLEAPAIEGKAVRVITVCGAPKSLSSEDVLSYVRIKPGHLVKAENIASDVRGLFDSGYFHRVDVVARSTQSGAVDLEIHLEAHPAVRDVAIEGAPNLAADDEVHKEIKVGWLVSRYALKRAASRLRDRYVKAGFEDATVTPAMTPASGGGVRVVIDVKEGVRTKIGAVSISGLPKDLEAEVRKIEQIAPGTPLSDYSLMLARTAVGHWFNSRGYFEATGDLDRGPRAADGSAPITIKMTEGPRYKVGAMKLAFGDAKLETEIRKTMRIRTGEPVESDRVRADVERMTEALHARGRQELVGVESMEDPKKKTVDLVFSLTSPQ